MKNPPDSVTKEKFLGSSRRLRFTICLPSLNCCLFSTNVAAMFIAQYSVVEDLGRAEPALVTSFQCFWLEPYNTPLAI